MFKLLRNSLNILSINSLKSIEFFGNNFKSFATKSKSKTRTNSSKEKKTMNSSENVYNPSKSDYNPIEDAIWKSGERVPYLAFATTLKTIEETAGRLKMIEILSNYLRSVIVLSSDDLIKSIYLCLNKVCPDYEGLELGLNSYNIFIQFD
jgi:DNA ligase-1